MSDLYPDANLHPYYIVAPPYSRFSAGIKVLHLLCDTLNRRGQRAFLLIIPDMPRGVAVVHPDFLTPRLTQDIMDAHAARKITPIVVYPEMFAGNPLHAPVVARYVMNVPGLLGGDLTYAPDELVFPYSESLAQNEAQKANVLYLPVSDTRIFHPPPPETPRSGSCYYAMKYKQRYAANFTPPEQDSLEITFVQSPEELATIFRRVEKFYCYENTATSLDAALCGCPTVSLPNEHLKTLIGSAELGTDGHAWGDTPDEIARAKATVGTMFERYQTSIRTFSAQLDSFITQTQTRAAQTPLVAPLRAPFARNYPVLCFGASFAAVVRSFLWRGEMRVLAHKGWKTLKRDGIGGVLRKLRRGTVG